MKKLALSVLMSMFMGSFALAADRVELKPISQTSVQAGIVDFSFELKDTKTGKGISDAALAVDMEKKLHMIVYDPSLREFQHVHPVFDGKVWNVQMNFAVDGNYWVWAQGKIAQGSVDFAAPTHLMVSGGQAAWPTPPALGEMRMGMSGTSMVMIADGQINAGQMNMLDLNFSRTDGATPNLSPYLGAFAHIVVVPESGDSLIHAHPMAMSATEGMVHITFPMAGAYRLWIQFVDDGNLKVIPLSVEVK